MFPQINSGWRVSLPLFQYAVGHAVLLPNGSQTALSRVTLRDRSGGYNQSVPEALKQHEMLERVYVDCGNLVLRSINFTWRDHSGNLVPLGEHDWSAQLCFCLLYTSPSPRDRG